MLHGAPSFGGENPSRGILIAQNAEAPSDTLALPDLSGIPAVDTTAVRPAGGVAPRTAMYHSMTLPGWGQLDNGKKKKAALFIAAELFFVGGAFYEQFLLGGDDLTSFDKEQIRTNRNTFIIYWLGARVFGLVDAYVDAHMKGFNVRDIAPASFKRPPEDVKEEPAPAPSPPGPTPPEAPSGQTPPDKPQTPDSPQTEKQPVKPEPEKKQ